MKHTDIKSIASIMKKYSPEILTGIGVAGTICTAMCSVSLYKKNVYYKRLRRLCPGYANEHCRYLQTIKSNNWLKMHGYPMRRKTNNK